MSSSVYWLEGAWPGKLAVIARPRGGVWLASEARTWQQAGLDAIVSLLTASENAELDLEQEGEQVGRRGLQFFTFPIADRNTPASFWETRNFIERLETLLLEGKNVGVHCRQGIGPLR